MKQSQRAIQPVKSFFWTESVKESTHLEEMELKIFCISATEQTGFAFAGARETDGFVVEMILLLVVRGGGGDGGSGDGDGGGGIGGGGDFLEDVVAEGGGGAGGGDDLGDVATCMERWSARLASTSSPRIFSRAQATLRPGASHVSGHIWSAA